MIVTALILFLILFESQTLNTIHNPQINVCRDYCRKGKWYADFEEIGVFNRIAFLAENTDSCNVGRSTNRGAVPTQGCA